MPSRTSWLNSTMFFLKESTRGSFQIRSETRVISPGITSIAQSVRIGAEKSEAKTPIMT
jgi:hypothetical protein